MFMFTLNFIRSFFFLLQVTDDLDRGWMLCTEEEKRKLKRHQNQGSRKEVYMYFVFCFIDNRIFQIF